MSPWVALNILALCAGLEGMGYLPRDCRWDLDCCLGSPGKTVVGPTACAVPIGIPLEEPGKEEVSSGNPLRMGQLQPRDLISSDTHASIHGQR